LARLQSGEFHDDQVLLADCTGTLTIADGPMFDLQIGPGGQP
jgi:hypothetical protein